MKERKDDVSKLKRLGDNSIKAQYENPKFHILETFPNAYPDSEYVVEFETKEFTSLCPKTGQPDFAEIKIRYMPLKSCVETKSLKMYLQAFRNHASFMETNTNKILNDLVHVINPKFLEVHAYFTPRGGIKANITATYLVGGDYGNL